MKSIKVLFVLLLFATPAKSAELIDFAVVGVLGTAVAGDSILTVDVSVPAWKKVVFPIDGDYFLNGLGEWAIPPGGTGTTLPTCTIGEMLQHDGTDWECIDAIVASFDPYTAGANIDITAGEISVTGLNLADLSDAGAAAYLDADNGEIGDVAVWVGVCSDTSFATEVLCLANAGTWGPALPISVGEAEVTVDAGLFAGKNLKSMLNELGQRVKGVESGTTPLTIGVQAGDPLAADMTTGQIIAATTSGDLFIRTAGGLFTIPGTYAAVTACSTPADGNIFNEGFEGVGYEVSGWTATGSVNPNNTPSGTGLTGSCERNLLVSADGANAYIHRDQGSALTYPVDIYFDVYIDSDDMAHNDMVTLLDSWSGSWGNVARVNVQRRTDGDYFRISATGAVNSSTTALALDTWYRVRLHLAATAASSYIKIGAGSDLSFTRQSVDIQLLRFGASSVSATETILLEMDRISVSDGS